jgi:murein DD-endopeptidase MepM/ murein hydrolase activator NlpD
MKELDTIDVTLPVDPGHPITAKCGQINNAYWTTFHKGTDFGAKRGKKGNIIPMDGSPIYSATPGIVQILGNDPAGLLGLRAWILWKMPSGQQIRCGYFHLSKTMLNLNQIITEGQLIALSGHSGTRRDGTPNPSHLHFQVETWPDRLVLCPRFKTKA